MPVGHRDTGSGKVVLREPFVASLHQRDRLRRSQRQVLRDVARNKETVQPVAQSPDLFGFMPPPVAREFHPLRNEVTQALQRIVVPTGIRDNQEHDSSQAGIMKSAHDLLGISERSAASRHEQIRVTCVPPR